LSGCVARFYACKRIEHWPKRELHLCRADGLSLLSEQLALEPLKLEGNERIQLAVLLALVLGSLASLCLKVVGATNARKRGDARLHLILAMRRTITHAPPSALNDSIARKAFVRPSFAAFFCALPGSRKRDAFEDQRELACIDQYRRGVRRRLACDLGPRLLLSEPSPAKSLDLDADASQSNVCRDSRSGR
jgi:hypothetical protein